MPVWMWVARFNKKVVNPRAVKQGTWPVLRHIGRKSGKVYRTPLGAPEVEGGYLFILMYGADSDWVQNVLAAGTATLEVGGDAVELVSPRLVSERAALALLPQSTKLPPRFLRVTEYLRMDTRPAFRG